MKLIKKIIFPTILLGTLLFASNAFAAEEGNDSELTGGKIIFYETNDSTLPSTSTDTKPSTSTSGSKVLPKTGENHTKSAMILGGFTLITVSAYGVYRHKEGNA